jgi:hypothetical protein
MMLRVVTLFFCILTLDKVFAQNDCATAAEIFRYPKFEELDPVGTRIEGPKEFIACKLFIVYSLNCKKIFN